VYKNLLTSVNPFPFGNHLRLPISSH